MSNYLRSRKNNSRETLSLDDFTKHKDLLKIINKADVIKNSHSARKGVYLKWDKYAGLARSLPENIFIILNPNTAIATNIDLNEFNNLLSQVKLA